ncbi:UNKNOWN [Stylonychia lemnae]|uniref:Uncharacterized protein n=1 Tax=Stylonychia lemnae TaxID=5949 RepID=A0A078A4T8_STYLE|nr:UNKNOWN [Stylonychia lemnae]|eukprot:CDW77280.1 UNKNOWN [Stylonychia lemnae]
MNLSVNSRNINCNYNDPKSPELKKFRSKKSSIEANQSTQSKSKQYLTFDSFRTQTRLKMQRNVFFNQDSSTMFGTQMFDSPYLNSTFAKDQTPAKIQNILTMNGSVLQGDSPYLDKLNQSLHSQLARSFSKQEKNDNKMAEKLKINMGFLSFKKAKRLSPQKFQFKQSEKHEFQNANQKFFKQNPQLLEFMKTYQAKPDDKKDKDEKGNKFGNEYDDQTNQNSPSRKKKLEEDSNVLFMNKRMKNVKEKSLLTVDKRALGIYDRFNDSIYAQQNTSKSPPTGQYFKYNTPVRVAQNSKQLVFMKDSQFEQNIIPQEHLKKTKDEIKFRKTVRTENLKQFGNNFKAQNNQQ